MGKLTVGPVTIGEGMPKICAPLTGRTEEELRIQCEEVRHSQADLVEWRIDFLNEKNIINRLNELITTVKEEIDPLPLIFTFRTAAEGGEKEITDEDYLLLNKKAIASKRIDLVDIELFRSEEVVTELINYAKENGVYTIVSNHDFEKTPEKAEIVSRLRRAVEFGANLPKIALMPQSERDVLTVLDATLTMKELFPDQLLITMSMGKIGIISRISGDIFGSALTFATVGEASAPGQIHVDQLKHCLQILHHDE